MLEVLKSDFLRGQICDPVLTLGMQLKLVEKYFIYLSFKRIIHGVLNLILQGRSTLVLFSKKSIILVLRFRVHKHPSFLGTVMVCQFLRCNFLVMGFSPQKNLRQTWSIMLHIFYFGNWEHCIKYIGKEDKVDVIRVTLSVVFRRLLDFRNPVW